MTRKDGYNEILKNLQGCKRHAEIARKNAESCNLNFMLKGLIDSVFYKIVIVTVQLRKAMENEGQPEDGEFDRKEEGTPTEQVQ